MSIISRINNLLPSINANLNRMDYPITGTDVRLVGSQLVLYPADGGQRYIDNGYKKNDAVFSIVSKNSEKCGQVRLYHLKVKKSEQKTLREYLHLTKGTMGPKEIKESGKMRKAMTEDLVVDSELSKLLNKPNRNQTQSSWITDLVGLRELQGEGNMWLNIPEGKKAPIELLNIPKPQLNLVGDTENPWEILYYQFVMSANTYNWEKDRVIMWKYENPSPVDPFTLEHLRGMAPLVAGIVMVQGMNEGDLRIATSNKNGGAAGLAFREDSRETPTSDQMIQMRTAFNNAVNSNEMAGKIALQAGKWGYHNFASSVRDQQLLEQYGVGFKRLCRIYKTPSGIFDEGNSTYDNQKQFNRQWIYSKIAPIVYGLRDKLNEHLLAKFELDNERHLIDCDISSLPELSEDLKDQVAAIKDVWELTPNQKLNYLGFEEVDDPNMDKRYVPSNLVPLDQLNEPIAGPLNNDMTLLGE